MITKKLFSYVWIFCLNLGFAQERIEAVDLSDFCPDEKSQYESTCYAYAVTYTAMSTEYNILNNITDKKIINDNWFSAGVVSSYNNSQLPLWSQSPRCGKYGTADKALKILKTIGTTFKNDYNCNCKGFGKVMRGIGTSKLYKISDFSTLEIHNKYSLESVNWIKDALAKKHPVITAIYQNDRLRGVKTPDIDDKIPDQETLNSFAFDTNGSSNHVVCILGYNDNYKDGVGYFLIKNNYTEWGNKKGYAWVPYTFFLPLINEAYYITGIY